MKYTILKQGAAEEVGQNYGNGAQRNAGKRRSTVRKKNIKLKITQLYEIFCQNCECIGPHSIFWLQIR